MNYSTTVSLFLEILFYLAWYCKVVFMILPLNIHGLLSNDKTTTNSLLQNILSVCGAHCTTTYLEIILFSEQSNLYWDGPLTTSVGVPAFYQTKYLNFNVFRTILMDLTLHGPHVLFFFLFMHLNYLPLFLMKHLDLILSFLSKLFLF